MKKNQFALLGQRRFFPFFSAQFLGAFNDNVFRVALATWLVYIYFEGEKATASTWINVAQALFILPFFLFSATAGQLADKYDKATVIRWVKAAEIVIMACAALAFWLGSPVWLVALLFLMGTQSAFFGPVKYSILPQHLNDHELLGGNALVETGTFLAILGGTMLGGWAIGLADGRHLVGLLLLSFAIMGWAAALWIPSAPSLTPELKVNWNFFTETARVLRDAKKNRVVFDSILAISWFWFFGSALITQMPAYASQFLGGDNSVFIGLLAMFSIGIAIGSLLCERLSGRRVEIGLVPLGAFGLSWLSAQLAWVTPMSKADDVALVNLSTFLSTASGWPVFLSVLGIGVFGGWFIVPLYALVQQRSDAAARSQVIAANNILNAGFMVVAAGLAIVLFALGATIPDLFLVVALLNALVALYIFWRVPEFVVRFIIWILLHFVYRVRHHNLDVIPTEGPAVLVANHVSFIDALLIAGFANRPVVFVMDHRIFNHPILGWFFRMAKTIPIAPAKEDAEIKAQAFEKISEALRSGELVMIFPEGKITYDGDINPFRPGIEEIIRRDPVPVIPMAIRGMWGSWFSRAGGAAMRGLPRHWLRHVEIVAGDPVSPDAVSAKGLESMVKILRGAQK